jgi:hypothetical protein
MTRLRSVISYIWKLPVCGLTFSVAYFAAAVVLTAAGLRPPALPPGVDAGRTGLISTALSPLVALGLAPLAAGLSGSYRLRWLVLALLAFVTLGAKTVIESSIFTTTFAAGGAAFVVLLNAAAALALGAVLARFFGPARQAAEGIPDRPAAWWAGRITLAVLAFPAVYLTFGMAISPIVAGHYRAGIAGLVLPGLGTILWVQVVRSALFLLASAPAIFLWAGSRRRLIAALGWANLVTVGLYGLLGAYWIPTVLRIAHALEITADSFAYALLLVMLLRPLPAQGRPSPCLDNAPEGLAKHLRFG